MLTVHVFSMPKFAVISFARALFKNVFVPYKYGTVPLYVVIFVTFFKSKFTLEREKRLKTKKDEKEIKILLSL